MKDEMIGKAEADKLTRIKTSKPMQPLFQGENTAKITIAQSDAFVKEARSARLAIAAEKVQEAKALEEAYVAEQMWDLIQINKIYERGT